MHRVPHERKSPWLVPAGVFGAWLIFTLMVMAISWGAAASRSRPFDFTSNTVWNLGWMLWAGATFGVRALARRFPIERRQLTRRLLLHVSFGLVVTALMLTVEFLLNDAVHAIWPTSFRPNPFVAFIVYKFHIYFLIYWLIVGVSGAFDYYAQLQRSELAASELEAQLAHAQVQALTMQLHPHFLFNTHHAIVSLMLKNENAAAIKMLTRLSDLLRLTLNKRDQQLCSLRDELELVDHYLGIQRERYRDRLSVEIEVEPEVLDAEVPCLLLQPLIENALQHGIDPQSADGRIAIVAKRVNDGLIILVRDNGPGLPPNFALEQQPGVGLGNTRARLLRLYGPQQNFAIESTKGTGTQVCVSLPFRVFTSEPARTNFLS